MKIMVYAGDGQREELQGSIRVDGEVNFSEAIRTQDEEYDAYFFLNDLPGEDFLKSHRRQPVFVNEVVRTSKESGFSDNVIRINAWPGFLKRTIWEAAGNLTAECVDAAALFGKSLHMVADVPGLVSARIICNIINEAYQVKSEGIAEERQIDLAMRKGTNYPYGPFEWCTLIGRERVHALLTQLATTDKRYTPLFQL